MNPGDYGKVAVLMGGSSAEREISLKSGAAVLAALLRRGVDAHSVDPDAGVLTLLREQAFDRAFIMLHGRGGEDGVIQGALETIGMPYTGCGVMASALGMDKYRTKLLWRGADLPSPAFALLRGESDLKAAEELGFPLMIKPAHEGSSIGMAKAEDPAQLASAWQQASRYDALVLAERWIDGGEYTCAVLEGEALPIIRMETPRGFYDYEAKYLADTTAYHCPAGLSAAAEADMRALALRAFEAVGGSGWGRVDILTDGQGHPWLLEVNTVPGMTDHSLVPMAARVQGLDFDELVMRILRTSLD